MVTGIDAVLLESASRTELLDSALHAPQAGFGDDDFYSDFFMKAAVLCTRIARNHPLPDGNKRLAWICLVTFCVSTVTNYSLRRKKQCELLLALLQAKCQKTNYVSGSVGSQQKWLRRSGEGSCARGRGLTQSKCFPGETARLQRRNRDGERPSQFHLMFVQSLTNVLALLQRR